MKSFMSRQGLVFLLLLATATTICESHEPNAEAEDFHLSDFSEENELDEAPSQWGPYVNQNEVSLYRIHTKIPWVPEPNKNLKK